MTRDSGGEGPTLEQVISQIRERWEDLGSLISDVQRALKNFQALKGQLADLERPRPDEPAP